MTTTSHRRIRPRLWIAAAVAALTIGAARTALAQRLEPRAFPQRRVESFRFRSALMDRQYDISVGRPAGYDANPDRAYPALVVTDGNRMFPMVWGLADAMMSQETIEDVLVISIGTPFELADDAWVRRRVYEFSPPGWAMTDPFGRIVRARCDSAEPVTPDPCVGGAPRFLQFIATELLPALSERFRIDHARPGLFGVSAGGFFASWAIFQERSPFKRYIISSPAMAYGDGEIERLEARYAETHKDMAAGIYLGSGSLEIDDPRLEAVGRIVSGQARLGALLRSRSYPSLVLQSEIHQGLGHIDTAPASLARGLRFLYPR